MASSGTEIGELVRRILAGEVSALARACRLVDERAPGTRELLRAVYPHRGHARTVGVTGAPGVGKSTLVDALIGELRRQGQRVGVLLVDPSSPFSGGALLGDRIRMQRHASDALVFIRSLATRGALGGLSQSASDLLLLIEAWGADTVLLETVGVGQSELDVLGVVETVVLAVMPGSGDDVQANKAGILEIADLIVLNKADRAGADMAETELQLALTLTRAAPARSSAAHHALTNAQVSDAANAQVSDAAESWSPAVVRTVATQGRGISELVQKLDAHRAWLRETELGSARCKTRACSGALALLSDALSVALLDEFEPLLGVLAQEIADGAVDPYTAEERLLSVLRQRLGQNRR